MITIKYPSREFPAAWRKAFNEGRSFCVEAHVSRSSRDSIRGYIDAMFKNKKSDAKGIYMIFCMRLIWCIGRAFGANSYDVDYSEKDGVLLIFFRRGRELANSGDSVPI